MTSTGQPKTSQGHASPSAPDGTSPTRRGGLTLIAAIGFVSLAVVLSLAAYPKMFSRFRSYDDEGYMLIMIDQLVRGGVWADEVYTQYGPFFALINLLIFKPSGIAITHDTVRFITIVLWVATSVGGSVLVWQRTANLFLASAAAFSVFMLLKRLANEPGHPQGYTALLLVLLVALPAVVPTRRHVLFATATGIMLGCLIQTKINVGVFAGCGLALAFTSCTHHAWTRNGFVAIACTTLALPYILVRAHGEHNAVVAFAVVTTMAVLSVAVQLAPARRSRRLPIQVGWILIASSLVTSLALAGLFLLRGSSLRAVVETCLLGPLRHSDVIFNLLPVDSFALTLAGIGFVGSLVTYRMRRTISGVRQVEKVVTGMKALYCLVFGYYVCQLSPGLIRSSTVGLHHLYVMSLPFLWLAAVVPRGKPSDPADYLVRNTLVAVTVFQSLVVYPISGTQIAMALFLHPLIVAICFFDVLRWLAAQHPKYATQPSLGQTAAIVSTLCVIGAIATTYSHWHQARSQLITLGLPGATRIRETAGKVPALRFLSLNLQNCDTFVTLPGLNSFYFWAGKSPPTALNATAWMTLLSDQQQRQIVESLESQTSVLAVRHENSEKLWIGNSDVDGKPLVQYIRQEFSPIAAVGGYKLLARRGTAPPNLVWCVQWRGIGDLRFRAEPDGGWECSVRLPAMPGNVISRLAVLHRPSGQLIADSHTNRDQDTVRVIQSDSESVESTFGPINLSVAQEFSLDVIPAIRKKDEISGKIVTESVPPSGDLVLILFDDQGDVISVVPFLK